MRSISVSVASSGDNTAIPADTNKTIRVFAVALTCASPIDVAIKDGTGTVMGTFQGVTAIVLDPLAGFPGLPAKPRFQLTRGNAFVLNLSGSVACKGTVWYVQE